jgi:predicted lipoprotein with Yx(FWY)xxD motif
LAAGALATVILGSAAVAASTLPFTTSASAKEFSVNTLTIRTEHVAKIGTVLATASGLTLYRFTHDPAGKATCTTVCAKVWPPLLLPKGVSHLKAPHGVKGLSLVRVAGGRLQVFFHHEALYGFVNDKRKGQAAGQGVGNAFFAVLADGKSSAPASVPTTTATAPVAPAATPKATTSTPGTSSTSSTPMTPAPTTTTAPPVTKSTTPAPTPPPPPPPPAPTTTTTQPPTTTTPTTGYGY